MAAAVWVGAAGLALAQPKPHPAPPVPHPAPPVVHPHVVPMPVPHPVAAHAVPGPLPHPVVDRHIAADVAKAAKTVPGNPVKRDATLTTPNGKTVQVEKVKTPEGTVKGVEVTGTNGGSVQKVTGPQGNTVEKVTTPDGRTLVDVKSAPANQAAMIDTVVKTLPTGYREVRIGDQLYYNHSGVYYRAVAAPGEGYVVVRNPLKPV
jgi:hypothetical protein